MKIILSQKELWKVLSVGVKGLYPHIMEGDDQVEAQILFELRVLDTSKISLMIVTTPAKSNSKSDESESKYLPGNWMKEEK